MSFSDHTRINHGAYGSPFSGVGLEFNPLATPPDTSGLVLYEVGFLAQNALWNFPNTFSPFWRLYFNFTPGHAVRFGGTDYPLEPGVLTLIPDHQLFDSCGEVPVEHYWSAFNPLRRLRPDHLLPLRLTATPAEEAILTEIRGSFLTEPTDKVRLYHASLALHHLVLSRPELRWQTEAPHPGLSKAVRWLETHVTDPALSVPRLAREAGLSEGAFSRLFHRHRGVTAARFIMQVRVREAARLLLAGDRTIDEIAENMGFPDRAYFDRVFKVITGRTPAAYRKGQTH